MARSSTRPHLGRRRQLPDVVLTVFVVVPVLRSRPIRTVTAGRRAVQAEAAQRGWRSGAVVGACTGLWRLAGLRQHLRHGRCVCVNCAFKLKVVRPIASLIPGRSG